MELARCRQFSIVLRRCRNSNILLRRHGHTTAALIEKLSQYGGGEVSLHFHSEHVASVTIDNHPKRNAMSGIMCTQLQAAVSELQQWDSGKCVVLRGAGSFFCSGADLDMVKSMPSSAEGRDYCNFMQQTLHSFSCLPFITVADINGPAIGGGAELAVATDYRLMRPDSTILFAHRRMGLTPGWGGGLALTRLVGSRKALSILTESRTIPAAECVKIGLADAVLPRLQGIQSERHIQGEPFQNGSNNSGSKDVDDVVQWLGDRLSGHPSVIQSMKAVVMTANLASSDHLLEAEGNVFELLWGGEANRAAIEQLGD